LSYGPQEGVSRVYAAWLGESSRRLALLSYGQSAQCGRCSPGSVGARRQGTLHRHAPIAGSSDRYDRPADNTGSNAPAGPGRARGPIRSGGVDGRGSSRCYHLSQALVYIAWLTTHLPAYTFGLCRDPMPRLLRSATHAPIAMMAKGRSHHGLHGQCSPTTTLEARKDTARPAAQKT